MQAMRLGVSDAGNKPFIFTKFTINSQELGQSLSLSFHARIGL